MGCVAARRMSKSSLSGVIGNMRDHTKDADYVVSRFDQQFFIKFMFSSFSALRVNRGSSEAFSK